MSMHFGTVNQPLSASLGGRAAYSIIAMSWNDETNEMRYLIAAKERPVWVSDQELVNVLVE
jgi:hypothetical protein